MKKLLFIFALVIAFGTYAQEQTKNRTFDIAAGLSQEGGFSFSLGSKKQAGLGFYLAFRGINMEEDYFSGIDYSSGSKTIITSEREEKANDFGITAGTLYNFKNSHFSIGGGIGYGVKQSRTVQNIKYDFQYISDEYAVQYIAVKDPGFMAEILVDFSLKKDLKNSFGLQAGYNSMHKALFLIYYSF